jgi:hypothetical protein
MTAWEGIHDNVFTQSPENEEKSIKKGYGLSLVLSSQTKSNKSNLNSRPLKSVS